MKPTPTTATPRIPGHADQKGIFPAVYTRQLMVSRPLTTMVVTPPSIHWSDLWLTFPVVFAFAIFRDQSISFLRPYHGKPPRDRPHLAGMACARSGQAPALPWSSDRSVRRDSGVKRDFACTFTWQFPPVLVALRSQWRLRLEGRTRTLSRPSPDLDQAPCHGDSPASDSVRLSSILLGGAGPVAEEMFPWNADRSPPSPIGLRRRAYRPGVRLLRAGTDQRKIIGEHASGVCVANSPVDLTQSLAAEAGASLGELMTWMGHSSTRTARIYLRAREERERQLAAALDKMARRELKASAAKRTTARSGT